METDHPHNTQKPSSLRWQILRRAIRRRPLSNCENSSEDIKFDKVSRRARNGFNLIPGLSVKASLEDSDSSPKRVLVSATHCRFLMLLIFSSVRDGKIWLILMTSKSVIDMILTTPDLSVSGLQRMYLPIIPCHVLVASGTKE